MRKRVAVITDATSAGYLFPYWHRYYSGQFGACNLHLLTYAGLSRAFKEVELGSLEELDAAYNDALRAEVISDRVARLLKTHDAVVRCDVDEFLYPHAEKHVSLAGYVDALPRPYVTATGIDIVEAQGDPPLVLDGRPLLAQRSWCIRTTSLNKIAITTVPMDWGAGFHASTAPPVFDDLFLLHMKFADVKGRIAWHEEMLKRVPPESSEFDYYNEGRVKLESFQAWFRRLPRSCSLIKSEEGDWQRSFVESVRLNVNSGFFQGDFRINGVLEKMSDITGLVVSSLQVQGVF